jgi:hypothetical protein
VLIIFIEQLKLDLGINLSIKDLEIWYFALNLIYRICLSLIGRKEKALCQLSFCGIPSLEYKLATDCFLEYFSIISNKLNVTIRVRVSS